MSDPHDLARFVDAQAPVIDRVVSELRSGRKTSHWMWFIFPQIQGLGSSAMAQRFAIGSLSEAEAYLRHELLGPRLATCTGLVNAIEGRPIGSILGSPDDMKFKSCMTLFSHATRNNSIYLQALGKYFGGAADDQTISKIKSQSPSHSDANRPQ